MELETLLARLSDFNSLTDPYGASHFPIYQTGTFDLKKQSGDRIYDYSRTDNPTRNALEDILTRAENGVACTCTNTGLSALALLFETVLRSGDSILVEADLYGGTNRLLNMLAERYCMNVFRADFTDHGAIETMLNTYQIRLVLCESPTNPGLKVIDLATLAGLCRKYGALFAVDNSLATFASQQPLVLGADFSVFSATKYISGHGAVIAGAIVAKQQEFGEKLAYYANAQGRTQSPFDAFLISLGLPTLPLRMKAQEQTALAIAEYLSTRSDIKRISFPFLPTHPQFALARQQMNICPGLLTIELETEARCEHFIKKARFWGEKASFGNSDSRVEQPVKISHASYSDAELQALGLSKCTMRLSVGLENQADLIADIEQALA